MTEYEVIQHVFPVECKGRNEYGREVLAEPEKVDVRVSKDPFSERLSIVPVDCKYNSGGHGQRCTASHPGIDKVGDGVLCPYSVDIPHVVDEFEINLRRTNG
jgi:hypothetical protein